MESIGEARTRRQRAEWRDPALGVASELDLP
jgi:hypothetical protein